MSVHLNQSDTDVISAPLSSAALTDNVSTASVNTIGTDIAGMIDEMQDILDDAILDIDVIDEDDIISPTVSNINQHENAMKQLRLSTITEKINSANDISDLYDIIKCLNAVQDIKNLLINKVNKLDLYSKEDHKIKKKRDTTNYLNYNIPINDKEENDEETGDESDISDDDDYNDDYDDYDESDNDDDEYKIEECKSLNKLHFRITPINEIFNDDILCLIIKYLSKC